MRSQFSLGFLGNPVAAYAVIVQVPMHSHRRSRDRAGYHVLIYLLVSGLNLAVCPVLEVTSSQLDRSASSTDGRVFLIAECLFRQVASAETYVCHLLSALAEFTRVGLFCSLGDTCFFGIRVEMQSVRFG